MSDIITNLRLSFPGGHKLSHGKAELMELLEETGSIRAAARRMEMSYRRAWLLVDEMNRMFDQLVVETRHGGASGGGATLTDFGKTVLARFRAMEKASASAIAADLEWLGARLARPNGAQDDD